MKRILFPLIGMALVLAGAQGFANNVPSHGRHTLTLKTQDGKTFQCDVQDHDLKKVATIQKGEKMELILRAEGGGPIENIFEEYTE